MRLDEILPEYTVREKHGRVVNANEEALWQAVRHLDFSSSKITKLLFKLRGLPTHGLTLDQMIKNGPFGIIAEDPGRELVIGLVCNHLMMPQSFNTLDEFLAIKGENINRIAWNFYLQKESNGISMTTETRVLCLGEKARRIFLPYWTLIRPFSGLIRLEMLKIAVGQVDSK